MRLFSMLDNDLRARPNSLCDITLTPHQADTLAWVVCRVQAGAALVALRGLAGTGKTSLIPPLVAALRTDTCSVLIGAPTHRAAHILRQKGLVDAATVHSLCTTAYFTPEYADAVRWLGGYAATPRRVC
jgi:hypothetical protein